jgi:nicastrin
MRSAFVLLGVLALTLSTTCTLADTSLDKPFASSFARLEHAPCVTLYHRNGRSGCGTESRDLQKGQLQYFDGNLPQTDSPYIAVMEDYDLTSQSLSTLMGSYGGNLQGVLVLNSTSENNDQEFTYHSPDTQSPRGYNTPSEGLNYGYYSYPWNSKGEGLLLHDYFGLPMAYVMDEDVCSSLRAEAQDQMKESAIVAEFNYYMGPEEISSKECLAWKDKATDDWVPKCLPLAGTSVWATPGSPRDTSSSNGSSNGNNDNNGGNRELSSSTPRPVVIVGTSIDSSSMFHDVTPGANSAASNILTLLMAAKLLGANLDDTTLDGLPKRIVLGFFQGDTFGFVGSRSFLKDVAYPGFNCDGNRVFAVPRNSETSEMACLHPLRPSLAFSRLGQIAGMISVDQVGHAVTDGILYVHADKENDSFGAFLANILKASQTSSFSVVDTSTEAGNSGYPYPPTPLTSLLALSGGSVGGAVLTGYDYAFQNTVPYHSHMDSATLHPIDMDAIAAAATVVARSALAAAYDSGDYDSDTAASYAANLIPEFSSSDSTLQELGSCLFYNGECDLLQKYAAMETANERIITGVNLNVGYPLGTPPNYYVSVYNRYYGQPFAQVGEYIYGAYDGEDYGKTTSDAITMQPRLLESAIHGLLDDFLGHGGKMETVGAKSCKKVSDCANVDYCYATGDSVTCSGSGVCVCRRAHFHMALDEALLAAKNKPTGYFEIDEDDQGISAMYTEPYWSNSVGVRVYRDVGMLPGFFTLVAGAAIAGVSMFAAFVLRVGLKKEKLY